MTPADSLLPRAAELGFDLLRLLAGLSLAFAVLLGLAILACVTGLAVAQAAGSPRDASR